MTIRRISYVLIYLYDSQVKMNHRSAEEKQGRLIESYKSQNSYEPICKASDRIHVGPKSGVYNESD